jgi:hypothetical protein
MRRLIGRSTFLRLTLLGLVATTAGALVVIASGYAQQNPPPPRPSAEALVQLTAIAEHYKGSTPEPLFTGEMNGFTFQRDAAPNFSACEGDRPHLSAAEHGSPALASSPLKFNATYVPAGLRPEVIRPMSDTSSGSVAVIQCGQTIVSVTERWSSGAAALAVTRQASAPIIQNRYSKDVLEPTTINGRPAIVVKPRFPGEAIAIYLRDNHSFWTVSSKGLTLDELRRVAQGLN